MELKNRHFNKITISILTVILSLTFFKYEAQAQDLFIENNPYDKATELEKSKNSFKRERWFYEQRMYPYNFIPEGAYERALQQRDEMRRTQGYGLRGENLWVNIGPTSGYYFSYGNISSRIPTVAFHPTNPNIYYIGAAFGGVWKSTNQGVNWVVKTDYEVSLSSGAIAIDPTNPNIIYYGTGEATYSAASYYGRGLLKSTDGGETWTNYTTGLSGTTYFSRIVIRPGFPNQLLAAMGNGGLFRSTDAGQSWTQVVATRVDDVVFDPTGNIAIMNGGPGVIRSTNGGVSFDQTTTGYVAGQRNHIAICTSNPDIMYASGYFSSGGTIRVYKSTDKGLTWAQVASGTNFSGSQAWYDFYIHVNPFDPNYVYVGSIDIWRSTNGGTSFSNITNGYNGGNVHVDQHNMTFHPTNPDILLAVNDGGIWRSTDRGTSFTNLNATLTLTQFYRMTSNPTNPLQFLGGTQDNGTQQTLGSLNWTGAFGGDGGEVCFHPVNTQYVLGETQNNGVQRSANGGASWQSATSGLTGTGSWVGPIIAHPDSATIFYTARQQVFKTTSWGASWFAISSGTTGTIREMSISKSNPAYMYATSGANIFKSTNRGYTYTNISSGQGLPTRTITSITVKPDNENDVLVCFSGFGAGKVYRTTNGGGNWFNVSGNLPDSPVNDVMHYYPGMSTNVLICATDVGVFMSNNNGGNWVELANGLPNTVAIHLDYNQMGNKLTIGTHGRGVYSLNGPLVNVTQTATEIPSQYSLEQNYPNPFNPITKIKYNIRQTGQVSLKVFDAMGREVSEIVNGNQGAGSYEVVFDASKLTSGIYFYKLQSNGFAETKKMMVIK